MSNGINPRIPKCCRFIKLMRNATEYNMHMCILSFHSTFCHSRFKCKVIKYVLTTLVKRVT